VTCARGAARSPVRAAGPTTVPSLLILGTDAVLAAAPATAVQLAHACMAAGYHTVIPASWGDELIAARAVERLRETSAPFVHCTCPFVSRRLSAHGDSLAPVLLCFVPPPVATAQYLRALYAPTEPRITFAGGCPGGSDPAIDVWMSPEELLGRLAERGVSTTAQPTEFDSVIPPDRRRYFSDPGGIPSRHALRQLPDAIDLVELKGEDVVIDLAEQLLSGARALIDLSLPLGCCCSGAVAKATPDLARARVREHEPPRAISPIVDHSASVKIDGIPPTPSTPPPLPRPPRASLPALTPRATRSTPAPPADSATESTVATAEPTPRRRSPPGLPKPVLGAMPVTRGTASGGRQLPRAYVARRSSPRGLRESALRREPPSGQTPQPGRPAIPRPWVAAIGVAIGLVLALLLRLLG
jgi:hypothetical protein